MTLTLPASTQFDPFGLSKLCRSLSNNACPAGPEDYVYTAGDSIYALGSVDPADSKHSTRSYKLTVTDPSGTVKRSTSCASPGSGGTVSDSYTVLNSDPVSTSVEWSYTISQYADSGCSTQSDTQTKLFDVAKVTTYSNPTLTPPQSIFGASATAYLRVAGMCPSTNAWSATWLLPSGATACANTTAGDQPNSNATGVLPATSGAFLQYRPNTTATGDDWNREANYETAPCPVFSSTNQGQWQLKLQKDATHFVTLDVFTIQPNTAPSITPQPSGATVNVGNSFTLSVTAIGTPTPTYQWYYGSTSGGTFSLISGATSRTYTVNSASLSDAGYYYVTVTNSAGSVNSDHVQVAVNKLNQTITFPVVADKTYGAADFDPGATASSGLAVSYSVGANDSCTIVGGKVHITGAGSCTVTASQSGNGTYNPAQDASRTFQIAKASATITIDSGTLSQTYDGTIKNVTAITNPQALSYSVAYTQNGVVATPKNAGSYNVVATITSPNYQGSDSGTLVIARADQTIAFGAPADKTYGDADFTVSATASSGLAVSFSTSSVCSVSGSTVKILSVGTCTVTASQAGNSNYNPANAGQSFKVTYKFTGFLQPINDPTVQPGQLTSVFKGGSTVPVKFQLLDANNNPVQAAAAPLWLTPVKGGPLTAAIDESTFTDAPTTGGTYRWTGAPDNQYMYGLGTKGMAVGYYWKLGVKLDDGQTYYVTIGLR